MISRDSVESAYAFFHQKWRVYEFSHSARQRDEIEVAISDYVEQMNPELLAELSGGDADYLCTHSTFSQQMPAAVARLEGMLFGPPPCSP